MLARLLRRTSLTVWGPVASLTSQEATCLVVLHVATVVHNQSSTYNNKHVWIGSVRMHTCRLSDVPAFEGTITALPAVLTKGALSSVLTSGAQTWKLLLGT